MVNKPEQVITHKLETPGVEEDTSSPAKAPATKKKTATKRKAKSRSKSAVAKSKRRNSPTRPLAPPPPPLTMEELKEQGVQAKQELVNAVVEPAVEAVGSLSQTIRDTIGGAFAGLLSRKRRND